MKKISAVVFVIVLLVSCGGRKPKREVFTYSGYAQGTTFSIIYDKNPGDLKKEIDKIFADIDASMSLYKEQSLICRFNRNDSVTQADAYFTDVFNLSKKIYTETEGAFDPTVFPLVKLWGFDKSQYLTPHVIDSMRIDSLRRLLGFNDIALVNGKPVKKRNGVMLDFNGIAQGYTVDVIAGMLDKFSVANYMIEVGGEVRAKGVNPEGEEWKIGIDKPLENADTRELIAIVKLSNMALATSGSYRKFYIKDGVKYSHTIDPFTGYPVKHSLISVSVLAPTCAEADAYATAFMVMGTEKTKEFISRHPSLNVYLISSNYKGDWVTWMSDGLKEKLTVIKD